MTTRQSLIAALLAIAAMIAIPIAVATGDQDAYRWQGPDAVRPAGHHYGWRNHANYPPGLIWDEDGDDCYTTQCDEDDEDCPWVWSDDNEDYEQADNSYGYNSGYNGAYNALDESNDTL